MGKVWCCEENFGTREITLYYGDQRLIKVEGEVKEENHRPCS